MKFLMIKNASGFACFDKENYVGHDPGGGGGGLSYGTDGDARRNF